MKTEDQGVDEFHGQGGSYIIENGKRRLVARTLDPTDPKHEGRKPQAAEAKKPTKGAQA